MKFSVNWLQEFVELPAKIEDLADLLTFAGIEIEGIERRGLDLANVVVAQINASAPHPNADRLSVCDVDDGTNHHRQIVCGAKNYKAGDKVPVALPGAELPNGLKIKVSKLRGVESQGMLCSPSELKISEESDGLFILSPEATIGAPIGSLFPADTILDVEITPNRGDLLSYLGLAREIAALSGTQVRLPQIAEAKTSSDPSVKIAARRECPFYSARRIENLSVGRSPDWLRAKLEGSGLRAVNNIVDITNFVMLELGQPLHAFDAEKLQGGITVRLARAGEQFLALDGKNYSLDENDLVIADDLRTLGIAGVMGGEDTGVSDTTRTVLLESAWFAPASIRRTARTLSLPSDASYRFERGIDPGMTLRASARAAQLMREIAGGQPSPNVTVAGDISITPVNVRLRYQRCDQLLGVSVPRGDLDRGLRNFGLLPTNANVEGTTWKIPTFRSDLKRDVDLIEEVVRQFGIKNIPSRNRSVFTPISEGDRGYDFEARTRQRLCALGFSEARTSALIPRGHERFSDGAVELKNPLSEDHVALRPSLLPGLLGVLERNLRAGARSVRLFELGHTFTPPDAGEKRRLALLCSGELQSAINWRAGKPRKLDFFDLKGAVESLGLSNSVSFRRTERTDLGFAAEILVRENVAGFAGQLHATAAAKLGANAPVLVLEMDLDSLGAESRAATKFSELDKFPSVTRDIAMIVPSHLAHEKIVAVMTGEPMLAQVEFFDLFSGMEAEKNLGAGRKSMAYTLTYRDKNRTLTNDEVNVVHTRIRERLKNELGAELRE
ncbi:MAG: phenylalanine--tRNA ligase subunit beta [Chthoniobacterales bacterium]